MSWQDFVAENEGPELDEARARLRGDEPPGVREPRGPRPIQPYDSDHTALVHVLWEGQRRGLTISDPDALAALIMRSEWIRAVRFHAAALKPKEKPDA